MEIVSSSQQINSLQNEKPSPSRVTQLQFAHSLREGAELRLRLLNELDSIAAAADAVNQCVQRGGKILLLGNGGSASDAQHIAAEFVGRFSCERPALPAISLTTDTSAMTAIANDYGFDQIFARQVRALARPGDVVVGISTSGNSPNVLRAIEAAKETNALTIGLTGEGGGALAQIADMMVMVPSRNVARIQECHITIGHMICEMVDSGFRSDLAPFIGDQAVQGTKMPKIVEWEPLLQFREAWRREGKVVVWTNGCFDLWHAGHVRSLQAAKRFGNVLVVGLNTDRSVSELKGPERPIVPQDQRAELLAALECVDYVILFDELTPEESLSRLKPDIHCKGADYEPPNGKPIPERALVESYGGTMAFIPFEYGVSTTELIARIRSIPPII